MNDNELAETEWASKIAAYARTGVGEGKLQPDSAWIALLMAARTILTEDGLTDRQAFEMIRRWVSRFERIAEQFET